MFCILEGKLCIREKVTMSLDYFYQGNDSSHIFRVNFSTRLYKFIFSGDVFNFDSIGVQKEKEGWEECACIVFIKDGSQSSEEKKWMKTWNKCLSSSLEDTEWAKERSVYVLCMIFLTNCFSLIFVCPNLENLHANFACL